MIETSYPSITKGPPVASSLVQPVSLSLPRDVERYVVPGSGAVLFKIHAGDEINIKNDEGGQSCEIVTADNKGRIDAGILGVKSNGKAEGLKRLFEHTIDDSLRRLCQNIENLGLDLAKAQSINCFDTSTLSGTEVNFSVMRDGVAIVAAPGDMMDIERQNTSSPLTLCLKRVSPKIKSQIFLPDPLDDPTTEIRVHSATAEAYFVKAGEYVQILDVEGRQCTDFQCFAARNLDKGIQNPIDATTTRTLVGSSYPVPGLYSKYFDHDFDPLVEVIQDTCGRHDAFALACSAKYYDDIGYPGHVNCWENFNNALESYGVSPRNGWMAINFFFNTGIDAQGVLYSDEPWSRSGDYVLLRALTDIVCVSSACPDDTSASNGWNPTDIHIRTYSAQRKFKRSITYRPTPDSEPKMTKETGFHQKLSQFSGDFVEYNGYWLANSYANSGAIEEYWACREKAVVMDLSPLRKFEITGPDSEALCQYVFTKDIKKLPIGGVVYTAMCYEHGGMVDDGTLFRLGKDNFRWIGGNDYGGEWIRENALKLGLNVLIRSSTDQLHNLAVQGPKSRELLSNIVWTAPNHPDLEQLQWFRFAPARIHSHNGIPIVLSRTGYTGELGYEVMCHPKHCDEVFDAIWESGSKFGMKPFGLEALDMVRIEAGLVFAGYEFCDQTDPFEAGIGFTVPLKSKQDDFVGRDALIQRKEHPQRKLVGLEIDSNESVGHGDCIHVGKPQIGIVTSATRSPLLGKNIALARVDSIHSEIGTKVEIGKLDGDKKRLPAKVVPFPHYDPEKKKVRM